MKLETKTSKPTYGQHSESILIKQTQIFLNFEPQSSPNNRPFRYSGIKKNLKKPSQWVDKVECWCWIYTFIYLDDQGGDFSFEFDYNNKLIGKV